MVYERGGRRAIVTFNGEIFNFREIWRSPRLRVSVWYRDRHRDHSASYFEWGDTHRFNGMWLLYIRPGSPAASWSRTGSGEKPCITVPGP
jgi:asparagine synthetase B (glutamine-hydrolysing)